MQKIGMGSKKVMVPKGMIQMICLRNQRPRRCLLQVSEKPTVFAVGKLIMLRIACHLRNYLRWNEDNWPRGVAGNVYKQVTTDSLPVSLKQGARFAIAMDTTPLFMGCLTDRKEMGLQLLWALQ